MSIQQVQFLKKELLNAMSAMETLMDENEFNLRYAGCAATATLVYRLWTPMYYFVTREKSRKATFSAMRMIVLAMERLLNLRNSASGLRPHDMTALTRTEHCVGGRRRQRRRRGQQGPAGGCRRGPHRSGAGAGEEMISTLDELDLGRFVLLVWQLRRIVWQHPRRFGRADLDNLSEDLAELMGDRGPISVPQQLCIVQRMQRCYKFL
ncbi:unnamed protein product, partial [Phaeothamnion confervicola]